MGDSLSYLDNLLITCDYISIQMVKVKCNITADYVLWLSRKFKHVSVTLTSNQNINFTTKQNGKTPHKRKVLCSLCF